MTTRKLNLTRPIVCFDLETTGLETKTDRIVEISCVKIHTDMNRELLTLRVNPQMPIPKLRLQCTESPTLTSPTSLHLIWSPDASPIF